MNQATALAILKSGNNVFLTGSAGAGKTYVLNQYIQYLKERKIPVAITASTGIAATHMNGMTIHSWSGIGIKDHLTGNDLRNLKGKKYLQKNLEDVKVLIIDEISMLHKNQLEMVNIILQAFKENEQAFGGTQVVFSGDFFQLPPVGSSSERNRDKFAFMSQAWVAAQLAICYITEQHRQEDQTLNQVLNEVRSGNAISNQTIDVLKNARFTQLDKNFTLLFTHNEDVDRINNEELGKLEDEGEYFLAQTKGNEKLIEVLKKSVLTEERLRLKRGAKVMFIKNNYEKGYMNGTLGEVIDFNNEEWPIVQLNNEKKITAEPEVWSMEDEKGKTLASFTQVPLRLAWAITVHKSQGMTLDAAEIDLSKTFEKGQGYVALSRLRDIEGLHLSGFNQTALEIDPLVRKADHRFRELSEQLNQNVDIKNLEKVAIQFIKHCGGLTNPEEIERNKKKQKEKKRPKRPTHEITKEYVEKGLSIEKIAHERGVVTGTIAGHIIKLHQLYPELDLSNYKPEQNVLEKLKEAYDEVVFQKDKQHFHEDGNPKSKALYDQLKGALDYNQIKLGLLFIEK